MRWITKDDIVDTYCKAKQRGTSFILSKLNLDSKARTKSTFDHKDITSSNWWIIPTLRRRRNQMITSDPDKSYETFVYENYLGERTNLKMLSLGSGNCSHELKFAAFPCFKEINCVDIAANRLAKAEMKAKEMGYSNLKFINSDVEKFDYGKSRYDVVLFNSSLHHFRNVEEILGIKVKNCLRENGILIINEYVGPKRQQYPDHQIKAINEALKLIPKKYRFRYKSTLIKTSYSGPGVMRMVLADPSECVESHKILPSLRKWYDYIYEVPTGGNIIMNSLRDIAHHFIDPNPEKVNALKKLIIFEDNYLKDHPSDFIFGIYHKKI